MLVNFYEILAHSYLNLPINSPATINVGAGQYISIRDAITILPIIPPNRAATIDIATPVALQEYVKNFILFGRTRPILVSNL